MASAQPTPPPHSILQCALLVLPLICSQRVYRPISQCLTSALFTSDAARPGALSCNPECYVRNLRGTLGPGGRGSSSSQRGAKVASGALCELDCVTPSRCAQMSALNVAGRAASRSKVVSHLSDEQYTEQEPSSID